MRLDPDVNRCKYEIELKRLIDQRATLEKRGIFLLGDSTYPNIDLFFAMRRPLRIALPAVPQPGSTPLPPNSKMAFDVPSLTGCSFKARFNLDDYDLRAPSLVFLDPWTDAPLKYETMFRGLEYEKVRGAHIVLLPDHPITHMPFLCLRGIREYHEHPQHTGDDWFLYRDDMSLFTLLLSVWRVTVDIVLPQIVVDQNGDQMQLQVQWVSDGKA